MKDGEKWDWNRFALRKRLVEGTYRSLGNTGACLSLRPPIPTQHDFIWTPYHPISLALRAHINMRNKT